MESNHNRTRIFDYSDYRKFLADYYESKKRANPGFSHRVFARQAGLSSPSHLLMIVKGERSLSLKTIAKFADGLKLTARERRYFECLVQYNQTEDLQAKAKFFAEIMSLKGALKGLHAVERERYEFLSKWYVVAIYVLIDLGDFRQDSVWISKRLVERISASQAREALAILERLEMIEGDPVKGYRQVSGALTVADDTRSMAVYNYHHSMIRLAAEALRQNNQERREMGGATIAIPKDKLPEIKEKIRAFRREINQLASSYANPDEVYQLNIQLFPLTSPVPSPSAGGQKEEK